jgi:hypothetical protein
MTMREKPEEKITRIAAIAAQKVLNDAATARAVLDTKIEMHITNTDASITEINAKLDKKYVTQDQFIPVKMIAYGLVGTILLSVIGGLMLLLFKTK